MRLHLKHPFTRNAHSQTVNLLKQSPRSVFCFYAEVLGDIDWVFQYLPYKSYLSQGRKVHLLLELSSSYVKSPTLLARGSSDA